MKAFQLRHSPTGTPASILYCTWKLQTSVRPQTYKGDFRIIRRYILCAIKTVILIMHTILFLYLFIIVFVVQLSVPKALLVLLLFGCFTDLSESIAKVHHKSIPLSAFLTQKVTSLIDTIFWGIVIIFNNYALILVLLPLQMGLHFLMRFFA